MEKISMELGLQINRSKTKMMVVDWAKSLHVIDVLPLEKVDDFIYLGTIMSNTGSCKKQIRRRIDIAKSAITHLQGIWIDRNIFEGQR